MNIFKFATFLKTDIYIYIWKLDKSIRHNFSVTLNAKLRVTEKLRLIGLSNFQIYHALRAHWALYIYIYIYIYFFFLTRILFAFILVMVNSEGFMEYIVQLIYSMANKTADHLRANPLLIAHCIGAMKIITAISISQEIHVMPLWLS